MNANTTLPIQAESFITTVLFSPWHESFLLLDILAVSHHYAA